MNAAQRNHAISSARDALFDAVGKIHKQYHVPRHTNESLVALFTSDNPPRLRTNLEGRPYQAAGWVFELFEIEAGGATSSEGLAVVKALNDLFSDFKDQVMLGDSTEALAALQAFRRDLNRLSQGPR